MESDRVLLDPETQTVRVGLGVTPRLLRRLYALQVVELVARDATSLTYRVRPAPPLVAARGGRAAQPGAAAGQAHAQLAAGEAHRHGAVAVGGRGDRHGARAGG